MIGASELFLVVAVSFAATTTEAIEKILVDATLATDEGRFDEADALLDTGLKLNPSKPLLAQLHLQKAIVAHLRRSPGSAVVHLVEALSNDPRTEVRTPKFKPSLVELFECAQSLAAAELSLMQIKERLQTAQAPNWTCPNTQPPPDDPEPPSRPLVRYEIHSSPTGASVHIDRKPAGSTPLVGEAPAGTYALELSLPGYYPQKAELALVEGKPSRLDRTLRKEAAFPTFPTVTLGAGLVAVAAGLVVGLDAESKASDGMNASGQADLGTGLAWSGGAVAAAGLTWLLIELL